MTAQQPAGPVRGTILLLSPDTALCRTLQPHFAVRGLLLRCVKSPPEAAQEIYGGGIDPEPPPLLLVLIDQRVFPRADLFARLSAAPASGHPRPLLVGLGQTENLGARAAALRAGAAACLPLDQPPAELAARAAALAAPPGGAPERVLVVDDQPVSALFAARVLERAGMTVTQVHDPLEVLPALGRFAPDLVLMDLHMPGISGLELTAVIREQERFADLPIVFLSVELEASRQLDALRVGADDFLAKPVPPPRLVACVRQRLARARHRALVRATAAPPPPAVADPPGLVDRNRLFARLDQLINARAGDWVVVYLELPPDVPGVQPLAAAVAARAGAGVGALAAGVDEHGLAVLVRSGQGRSCGAFAEALGRLVRAALPGRPGEGMPSLGVGWCTVPAGGGESVTLVSRARKAARVSLSHHDGRARGYSRAAADPVLEAVAAERFQLLFQPMLPLRSAVAERYEATPRVAMPDGELLAPAAFMPAVQRAGRSAAVDHWLLTAGLDALCERRDLGQPVALFLHQSCQSLSDDGWVDALRAAISARDLVHFRPVIQFEASELAEHLEVAAQRAARLGTLGIRLCLNGLSDDASGLRVLDTLPAAYARLSRNLLGAPAPRLRALVERAHERRVRVIMTGVAGPESIAALHLAGVDLLQGPYIAPPGEAMDFEFTEG